MCMTDLLNRQKPKVTDALSVCVSVSGYRDSIYIICPLIKNKKACLGNSDGSVVLLVRLADIQIVWRYPEAAAEKCNLSHCIGPGYEVDYEKGRERYRKRGRERLPLG